METERILTQREALYRAICQNPWEDTPRLVYADYLDEQDSEEDHDRAEYIRLSVQLQNPPGDTSFAAIAQWREKERRLRQLEMHYIYGQYEGNPKPWHKWDWVNCPKCMGDRTTPPNHNVSCDVCWRARSLTRFSNTNEPNHAFIVTARNKKFARGFLEMVDCQVAKKRNELLDGWGEALVRTTPVTRIKIAGKVPRRHNQIKIAGKVPRRHNQTAYRWYQTPDREAISLFNRQQTHPYFLPAWLFDEMRTRYHTNHRDAVMATEALEFSNEHDANMALELTACDVVRRKVWSDVVNPNFPQLHPIPRRV